MITVKHHIEKCISKSRQLMVAEDILELEGLIIGHGPDGSSWSYRADGDQMVIHHVFGRWSAFGAVFMAQLFKDARRLGCGRISWDGRPGWERFLKKEGWIDG